ncbi:MAG TPA: pyridoxamine 5'-phosphate oxidase family protein [Pyrinomonadaceae bacterium]|nr:pyridoxamine 5'-phosphate oxidase family protein [Pyrinomonadaceae bacterium]
MDKNASRDEAIKKLGELIRDIEFAMLTTVEDDGSLRARPMQTQGAEFDGTLWFFTHAREAKVEEVERDARVGVAYAKPEANRYVSVSGTGRIVRDRAKIEELWNPALKAWFPEGQNDPNIALIEVTVDHAEYWDAPSSNFVQLAGFVKAVATGEEYRPGENEKLDLKRGA